MLSDNDLMPRSREMWREIQGYFLRTDGDRLETIRAAHDRGRSREPRRQDIFVHPQFPFSWAARVKNGFDPVYGEQLAAYETRLRELMRATQNPVFITYTEGREDWPQLDVPDERAIPSVPYHSQVTGAIYPRCLELLLELFDGIHPDDEFRIHGAAYGCCPTEFATQLYGLVYAGQFWPDIPPHQKRDDNVAYHISQCIRTIIDLNALLEKSRIRLGTVHDSNRKIELLLSLNDMKPPSIQLVDEKTEIMPYERASLYARIEAAFRAVSD